LGYGHHFTVEHILGDIEGNDSPAATSGGHVTFHFEWRYRSIGAVGIDGVCAAVVDTGCEEGFAAFGVGYTFFGLWFTVER
jgi:hypothetical protein